jgi:trimeric autotransporter adhesin
MRRKRILALFMGVSLLWVMQVRAQESKPASERPGSSGRDMAAEPNSFATNRGVSQEAQAAAPRVLKFSGVLLDASGKPLSGEVEVTFALYKQEGDEIPLWTETQRVEADERGGYTAFLGARQLTGIPAELFRSDEARWLGVQIAGQTQQPRTILVSVPYALKAVEAEKLSGKSLSDFVMSDSLGEQVRRVMEGQALVAGQATSTGTTQPGQTKTNSTSAPPATAAGPMFPPSTFSGTNATQIVSVQQNGSGNGLYAQTASATGNSAVVGVATSNSTSNNQNGVIGFNAGGGAGVAGIATNPSAGVGVYGQSATGFAGVFGNSVVNSGFAAGVFGTTSSPDGAGVHGANNSANGFATGVTGFSASANGNAVFGSASATSGFANGVFGQTNSPGGSGVLGIENATTGFNSGVSGSSASANGTGVFGSSFQWVGVGGQATAPSGGPAFGVWGDSLSTGGTGVAGFADATSGFTNGVSGQSASPNGTGVLGVANATSGSANGVSGQSASPNGIGVAGFANAASGFNNGVYGQTASNQGDAVHGDAVNTSGNAVGVFGTTVGTGGGIGVWGVSSASSGGSVGVRGDLESPTANGAAGLFLTFSPTSVAGQFANFSRQGLILQGLSGPFDATQKEVFSVDANGNLHITGNLLVDGTKSSTAKLQNGREVALYAVESPENWFEDFGSAELKSGVAWVALDASFGEATNATLTYHVFLTPNGDSNGLYVARKTAVGFEVREHGGGGSNVPFDYRIVVRRRGYETTRMAEVQHDTRIQDLSRQHFRQLNSSEITNRAGAIKAPIIPAIRPVQARPSVPQPPKPSIPQAPKVNVAQPRPPR